MTEPVALPVLLSRVLGRLTVDLEAQPAEVPMSSLAVWANVLRVVDGGSERDLASGGLREDGMDAVGVVERTDLRALADDAVLEFAHDERRALVTRNIADFVRLSQQWRAGGRTPPGLVLITEHAFPQGRNLVGALVLALLECQAKKTFPQPGHELYLRAASPARQD